MFFSTVLRLHGVHNVGFLASSMNADESCKIFLGHYKTIFPCWKLVFAWLSQQKEHDGHSSAAQFVLCCELVPWHKSTSATRSKVLNGKWSG